MSSIQSKLGKHTKKQKMKMKREKKSKPIEK